MKTQDCHICRCYSRGQMAARQKTLGCFFLVFSGPVIPVCVILTCIDGINTEVSGMFSPVFSSPVIRVGVTHLDRKQQDCMKTRD